MAGKGGEEVISSPDNRYSRQATGNPVESVGKSVEEIVGTTDFSYTTRATGTPHEVFGKSQDEIISTSGDNYAKQTTGAPVEVFGRQPDIMESSNDIKYSTQYSVDQAYTPKSCGKDEIVAETENRYVQSAVGAPELKSFQAEDIMKTEETNRYSEASKGAHYASAEVGKPSMIFVYLFNVVSYWRRPFSIFCNKQKG